MSSSLRFPGSLGETSGLSFGGRQTRKHLMFANKQTSKHSMFANEESSENLKQTGSRSNSSLLLKKLKKAWPKEFYF